MPLTKEEIDGFLKAPRQTPFVEMPDHLEPLLQNLVNYINSYTAFGGTMLSVTDFSELLSRNNAIIAGGFITNTISLPIFPNGIHTDLDIYVPCKNLETFLTEFIDFLKDRPHTINHRKPSPYCKSFLRRNGIRSVLTLNLRGRSYDIMAVRNARPPIEVAQNFDLSFCQNWYDGKMVYSTHPQHVLNKVGYLQNDYVDSYHSGNVFIKKRLEKYINRGFQVFIEPNVSQIIIKNSFVGNVRKDEKFMHSWIVQAMLQYIITGEYYSYTSCGNLSTNVRKQHLRRRLIGPQAIYNPMDGYDSDEYDERDENDKRVLGSKFHALAERYAHAHNPNLDPLTPEEKFTHMLRKLIEKISTEDYKNNIIIQIEYNGYDVNDATVAALLYANNFIKPINKYITRVGTCAISMDDDVKVYDIHAHTFDQAICSKSMEEYLTQYIPLSDKSNIPCYDKDCNEHITLDTIIPIVSDEFYQAYSSNYVAPQSTNIRNTLVTNAMNKVVLQDTPSRTDSWGEIYSMSVCPFCLTIHSRDKGCIYVTHPVLDNYYPKKPYCPKQLMVKEILQKYENAALQAFPRGADARNYLQFCTICGRPSVNHHHFTISENPSLAPQVLRPVRNGNDPNERIEDYGACPGGGRAEMIARLLAIRKVIKEYQGNDKEELRTLAAIAADFAGLDQELLAKAREILAVNPDDREFQNGTTELVAARMGITGPPANQVDAMREALPAEQELNNIHENNLQRGGKNKTRTQKNLKISKTRKYLKKKSAYYGIP